MRREQRHGFARIWHRLVFGALDFGSAEQSVASDAVEHTIARALRCFREAVGAAQLRRLWQRDVKAQDLVFAQRLFELNRPDRLPDLGVERTLSSGLEQTSNLHGDGRAA